jgi:hypothetical protein
MTANEPIGGGTRCVRRPTTLVIPPIKVFFHMLAGIIAWCGHPSGWGAHHANRKNGARKLDAWCITDFGRRDARAARVQAEMKLAVVLVEVGGCGGGDNRFPLLDVRAAGSMLVDMRIILIPLALIAAVVIAMALLAARGRPPTPIGSALAMNASLP